MTDWWAGARCTSWSHPTEKCNHVGMTRMVARRSCAVCREIGQYVGGPVKLIDLDPFVAGVGLGDRTGTEDDRRRSDLVIRGSIGPKRNAGSLTAPAMGANDHCQPVGNTGVASVR